jgi:FlgD Ig-like domain
MKKISAVSISILLALVLAASAVFGADRGAPLVINHLCADLAAIPNEAIQAAQDVCKWHYARLSHGRQLMVGFEMIEAADPFYAAIWPKTGGSLPVAPGVLCIYTSAVASDSYWRGSGLDVTRAILNGTPALNISAMSWCAELNTASESYVQEYLAAMQTLESEFPNVTFVYFTGTAQDSTGYGYNRYLRNKQIRDFCVENNKVLYDFEDLDCWWFNPTTEQWEHSTYEYSGFTVPVEHPSLAGDDAEHTSYESCEQKGRAAWWMMAMLSGWTPTTDVGDGSGDGVPPAAPYKGFDLSCYPNPFNPSTTITFSLAEPTYARLTIYGASGEIVRTLISGDLGGGMQRVQWNGRNDAGAPVASGVYFYRITADNKTSTKKILLLR